MGSTTGRVRTADDESECEPKRVAEIVVVDVEAEVLEDVVTDATGSLGVAEDGEEGGGDKVIMRAVFGCADCDIDGVTLTSVT